jgi:hypothetical protein
MKKRCQNCKTNTNGLEMTCKYCQSITCVKCIMPEIHNCEKFDECKTESKLRIEQELLKNKYEKRKLMCI